MWKTVEPSTPTVADEIEQTARQLCIDAHQDPDAIVFVILPHATRQQTVLWKTYSSIAFRLVMDHSQDLIDG